MKKGNYEQPQLRLKQIDRVDVITASANSMGEDDFGREDIFDD